MLLQRLTYVYMRSCWPFW